MTNYPNSHQSQRRRDDLLVELRASQCLPVTKAQKQLDELFLLLEQQHAPLKLLEAYDMQIKILRMNGKWQTCKELLDKGLALSREINQAEYIAKFLNYLSFWYKIMNLRDQSQQYTKEALSISRKYNIVKEEIRVYLDIGHRCYLNFKPDEGVRYYMKGIELAKTLEDDLMLGLAYYNYSFVAPDKNTKESLIEKAIEIFTKHKSLKRLFSVYSRLVSVNVNAGDFDKGIEYANKTYEIAQQTEAADHRCFSLMGLVTSYTSKAVEDEDHIDMEMLRKADNWATELVDFTRDREQRQQFQNASILKAQALLYLKEYDQAIDYLLNIEEVFNSSMLPKNRYGMAFILSKCYEGKGDFENALKYYKILTDLDKKEHDLKMQKVVQETDAQFQAKEKKAELRRLKELEELKTRFFSQITHELRTPLTLIKGPAHQISEMNDPVEMIKQSRIIERNADRLLLLVNQLLDISKLEAGKMELKKSHGRLTPFLEEIVSSFQTLAHQKQIQFEFISDIDDLVFNFDADKLEKILYNLLSNAFKFTPNNGHIICQFQLSGSVDEKIQNVEFIISDTGKGIAEEEINHIFDRFYQADSSYTREAEGTGIGLALVKELIDLMNGQIEVKSKVGEGSIFRLTLPLELGADEELEENVSALVKAQRHQVEIFSQLKNNPDVSEGKPILLLIEDNVDMHHYITGIFENEFILLQAYDGVEGIKLAKERVPDIIISDVMMPIKDGYQVCSELKEDIITSHIPVILLTAKAALESRIEGLEHGADAYLSKPFSAKELVLQTHNLIATRNNQQAKYRTFPTNQVADKVEEDKEAAFLNKVLELIDKNIHDANLNVNYLSNLMLVSNSQLYRKIQALTNTSVSQFIRNTRLSKGKQLLEKKKGNISEIAYKIGLTPSYFSRSFTKVYGYSPKELLK